MTQIANHADLAAHLGANEATEESISRRVYKGTTCGAWSHLEDSIPVGTWKEETWLFDIKDREGFGPELARVRREHDAEWTAPKDAPKDVLGALFGHTWEQGFCILTDKETIQFAKDNPVTKEDPYYRIEGLRSYSGGYAPGVSFGSIVEGVEMTTQIYTVSYPCTEADIQEALEAVEGEAKTIWNETHGCPKCWGGKETVNLFGWVSQDGDDLGVRVVDPNCPECHGQGVVI